jgi:hypothetical protein
VDLSVRFTALIHRLACAVFRAGAVLEPAALDLAAADAVLKDDYKGAVVETLNNANVLLAQLKRNKDDFTGRRWVRALHIGRNRGVGARAESGTLPTAGAQQYDNIMGPVRYQYVTIQLTGPTIAAMTKGRGAFLNALDSEMKGATTDGTKDLARQVWGTSDGIIGLCAGDSSGTTVTVTNGATRPDIMRHLEDDFAIDILDTSGSNALLAAVPTGGLAVKSVNYAAGTFVVEKLDGTAADAIDPDATDKIVRHGAYGVNTNTGAPGDGQIELTGMQTIIDDTATLHTLAPSTEPRWAAKEYNNSGTARVISENLVTQALMEAETRSGAMPDLLIGSDGVFRAYSNLLTGLRRNTQEVELKGGYTGTSISAAKAGRGGGKTQALVWDFDAPSKSLYGISTSDLDVAELQDWDWMDRDGAVLSRHATQDAYLGTLFAYLDIVCTKRNSHFVIGDISES